MLREAEIEATEMNGVVIEDDPLMALIYPLARRDALAEVLRVLES